MTMGNQATLDFLNVIQNALGNLNKGAKNDYEPFAERVRYLARLNMGARPRYHKGISGKKYDYWTCGNCGAGITGINDNFCCGCGAKILWDDIRCLTGIKEG